MTMLAGVSETRDFLRYDGADNDDIIEQAIIDASDAVMRYLKVQDGYYEYPEQVPGAVRRATMMYVGIMLRDPSGAESSSGDHGYPPRVVMNLLYPYRDPAMS